MPQDTQKCEPVNAVDLIAAHEGLALKAYLDIDHSETIGYGQHLDSMTIVFRQLRLRGSMEIRQALAVLRNRRPMDREERNSNRHWEDPMSDLLKVSRQLIDPIYSQSHTNQPIELGRVAIQFDHKGAAYPGTAKVAMRFVPEKRLEFVCPLEDKFRLFGAESFDAGREEKLALTDRGITIDVFCSAVGGDHDEIVFTPKTSSVMATRPSNNISTATFHLFNFPDFFGPQDYILATCEPPRQSSRRCGRVVLSAYGWNITVAATDRTNSLTKGLEAQGGYALTHMGRIAREEGSTFSSEQLEDLLSCLHCFLSFALGRWAGVALPIGFDAQENKVFERWGMRKTADGLWNGSYSWFDRHHGELLSQVFPGFMSLWTNKLWRRPLTDALYWYLGACDRRVGIGVDTGLILAQTALELLAWTYCVLDRKMVSPSAFRPRGLSAADKLRLLASSLGIPLEIPSDLSALFSKRGRKWADGMDAITGIRNSLVHPDSQTELPDYSSFEGWKLSLWYIDLVLLRLCGYGGKYANRLAPRSTGEVESVPWTQNEADKE